MTVDETRATLAISRQPEGLRLASLQSRHWPEIQQQARGLDTAKVLSLVRGG